MTTLFGKVTPAFIYHITLLVENSHVIGIRNIMCLCDGPEKDNQNHNHMEGHVWDIHTTAQKKEKTPYLFWSLPFPLAVSSFSILMKSESRASQDVTLQEIKQEASYDRRLSSLFPDSPYSFSVGFPSEVCSWMPPVNVPVFSPWWVRVIKNSV